MFKWVPRVTRLIFDIADCLTYNCHRALQVWVCLHTLATFREGVQPSHVHWHLGTQIYRPPIHMLTGRESPFISS